MEENQPKKSFIHRFWWIGIIIFLVIILIFIFSKAIFKSDDSKDKKKDFNQTEKMEDEKAINAAEQEAKKKANPPDFVAIGETKQFTDTQLTAANAALISGIKIDDSQNDWLKVAKGTTQPDGKEDNSEPYPLGWSDLKSLNVGADENYIYIKFNLWDRFPSKAFSYKGDMIDDGSFKINYFTFQNSEGTKDWADLITPMSLREQSNGELMPSEIIAMISPKNRDARGETIFTTYSKDGLFIGGPGKDYLLSAFPLKQFNLKLGDKVTFDCVTEIGSEMYHHEAIDLLFGQDGSKFADTIEYVLGSNTYKSTPQQNEASHS